VTGALQIFRASRSTNLQPRRTTGGDATNVWVLTRRGPAPDSLINFSGAETVRYYSTSVLVHPSFSLALNPLRKTNFSSSFPLRKYRCLTRFSRQILVRATMSHATFLSPRTSSGPSRLYPTFPIRFVPYLYASLGRSGCY
jgi:hypothetical protein